MLTFVYVTRIRDHIPQLFVVSCGSLVDNDYELVIQSISEPAKEISVRVCRLIIIAFSYNTCETIEEYVLARALTRHKDQSYATWFARLLH